MPQTVNAAQQLRESQLPMLLQKLVAALPDLLGVWLFGSVAQGVAGPDSDLDVAVLVAGKADPVALWNLSQDLATALHGEVDLVDLRAASTVLQYQVITTGRRLWQRDAQAALYESFILSEKCELDERRAGLLADIRREGKIFR